MKAIGKMTRNTESESAIILTGTSTKVSGWKTRSTEMENTR